MKKYLILAMFFVLAAALISPVSVSAAAKAGVKSGSFFYFFDTASEKINLFFTFNSEKKAKKALEYAEERLAEAEESASENKPEAVAEAMKDYQENISLAEAEVKLVKDETKTKTLLSTIASSTSKHQEILTEVLSKVPEEAKEAIEKAIEASKKGREEAMKETEDIEKGVSEITQEPEEIKNEEEQTKSNDDKEDNKKNESKKDEQKKEIEKLKKEVKTLKQKQPQIKIIEKIIEKEKPIIIEKKESSSSQTKQNENIVTLPSGAVVEMDKDGNVARTIKEVPQTTYVAPILATQKEKLEITSVNVVSSQTSAKIEWTTNKSTESKLYLSGGGLTSKLFTSEAGYATNHFANISQLVPITDYSFQITAIGNSGFANHIGGFKTKTPSPTVKFDQASQGVSLGTQGFRISWKSTYTDSCLASGAWSGPKSINGEEILSFNQTGSYTYTLACVGKNGENVVESISVNVFNTKPNITFYFNDTPSNTFSGKVGETVKLRWETSNTGGTNSCTASNSWSGSKYISGSQNILLETAGKFSYTLTCINGGSGEGGTNTATITVAQDDYSGGLPLASP